VGKKLDHKKKNWATRAQISLTPPLKPDSVGTKAPKESGKKKRGKSIVAVKPVGKRK